MIYVTSDLHMNNKNVIRYCNRPFQDPIEMNEALIANWNSVVEPEDTVYVLGDFIMGQADTVPGILNQLNGTIVLIRGNHDTDSKMEKYQQLGIETHLIYYLEYKGLYFIMCHFPFESQQYWQLITKNNTNTILLYGHIHDNAPTGYQGDKMYHVGVDTNNYTPISIEQIYQEVTAYETEKGTISF